MRCYLGMARAAYQSWRHVSLLLASSIWRSFSWRIYSWL